MPITLATQAHSSSGRMCARWQLECSHRLSGVTRICKWLGSASRRHGEIDHGRWMPLSLRVCVYSVSKTVPFPSWTLQLRSIRNTVITWYRPSLLAYIVQNEIQRSNRNWICLLDEFLFYEPVVLRRHGLCDNAPCQASFIWPILTACRLWRLQGTKMSLKQETLQVHRDKDATAGLEQTCERSGDWSCTQSLIEHGNFSNLHRPQHCDSIRLHTLSVPSLVFDILEPDVDGDRYVPIVLVDRPQ